MSAGPNHRPGPGRGKSWQPTDAQRQTAITLFGLGATYGQVAKQLGIAKSTAQQHLKEEFETGWDMANLRLYGALFEKAVVKKDTACLIFLAKNRLGMSDRHDLKSGDQPLPPAREELCLRVVYVFPNDPRANPGPPAHLLEAPTLDAKAS
jgi:hypothetical protein